MSAHPADMERAEELRERVNYALENMNAARQKVFDAHADYELAKKAYAAASRAYLDFKPVVEGQTNVG